MLKQKAKVIWFYGLSGSGKTTLARELERVLLKEGFWVSVLDGDILRDGLNKDLGFSDEDRKENIRRTAEVSKLLLRSNVISINAFITPFKELRELVKEIIGKENFLDIYVKCSYEICEKRDVKGLYAKAQSGEVDQFTGRDSGFEGPDESSLVIDTENESIENSLEKIYAYVRPHLLI